MLRSISRVVLAIVFIGAGVLHFVKTPLYLSIMPPYLPQPKLLVWISGVFEILGGIGVLPRRARRFSGYGLIALLIVVLPANLHMATHAEKFPIAPIWLWLRLPLQGVLIAWVWWSVKDGK